ncbi:MAG: protein YgfX [Telluria sp.]
MSIATSAVVAPSRLLRALAALFGACNVAAAAAVSFPVDRFRLAPLCAAFFLLAAARLAQAAARPNKTLRIDISGLGQLRLTVQQDLRGRSAHSQNAVPVVLLSGSTLWPQLMLLRLRSDDGEVVVLPVLRDSVTPQQFRALAVALRAAGGKDAAGPYHPILGHEKIF